MIELNGFRKKIGKLMISQTDHKIKQYFSVPIVIIDSRGNAINFKYSFLNDNLLAFKECIRV